MKSHSTLAALFAIAFSISAQDVKPLLHDHPLPLIAAPSFAEPLDDSFSIAKGKWTAEGGVLSVLDLPEQKHIPVLHHRVGLVNAVIEVEFLLEGAGGNFLVGCDSTRIMQWSSGTEVVGPRFGGRSRPSRSAFCGVVRA